MISFCAGPTSRLTDQVHILIKLRVMINGCHAQSVHYCSNLSLAHLNVGLFPLDRTVVMTYLYPTDEDLNRAPITLRACAAHAARPSPFT